MTSPQGEARRLWVVAGVAGLVLVFAIHLALISHANTITWDEPDHIYSGYMSWHGDFGLNPEHPPLVKFVATLPLLPMQLNVPELQDRSYRMQAVLGGRDFIFHNDADKIVFRAQMAASSFTLLLVVIAFLAAREMFGTSAGFLALGLLVFDPTLLAHGALVTTDAAQSCFLLASIYAFYRYVQLPSAGRLMKADVFLAGKRLPEALQEARQAVALAPGSAEVNAGMGNVLDALGRRAEARPYYATALQLALTRQPEFQHWLVASLKKRLAAEDDGAE